MDGRHVPRAHWRFAPVMAGLVPATGHDVTEREYSSPLLDPWPQRDLESPGRAVLAVQLKTDVRDTIGVGEVVVDARSCKTMRPCAIGLRPADRRVDRYIGDMDALGHQLARHAF